jgi:hypothetical protein
MGASMRSPSYVRVAKSLSAAVSEPVGSAYLRADGGTDCGTVVENRLIKR